MGETIEERVKDVVASMLCIDKKNVTLDSRIVEDLDADSMELVEIVMELEDEFDIELPDKKLEEFKTVRNILDYVTSVFM